MLETRPRKRFNMQTVLGFLLGVAASLLWLFFALFLSGTLGPRHTRLYPLFAGLGFAAFGLIALRKARSSYAFGIAIAFGLAILVLVAYTVAILRTP